MKDKYFTYLLVMFLVVLFLDAIVTYLFVEDEFGNINEYNPTAKLSMQRFGKEHIFFFVLLQASLVFCFLMTGNLFYSYKKITGKWYYSIGYWTPIIFTLLLTFNHWYGFLSWTHHILPLEEHISGFSGYNGLIYMLTLSFALPSIIILYFLEDS